MMEEIGGYFEQEPPADGPEYYPDLIRLNCARNALEYIAEAQGLTKIYIPEFLCDCVIDVCEKIGLEYEHYKIDRSFRPIFEKEIRPSERLYIVNYYGQLSSDEVLSYKKQFEFIIIDNVQAFFEKPVPNVDTIYSCRKFFGVADGAYLATDTPLKRDLAQDDSSGRLKHILGRGVDGAGAHYDEFKRNEELLYSVPMLRMSNETKNALNFIDYSKVKTVREQNYHVLDLLFKNINELSLIPPPGPYCYPLMISGAREIRAELAKRRIYVPMLWPNVQGVGGLEEEYAYDILPLPCDQRYGEKEMAHIYEVVIDLLKGIKK